MYYCKRTLTYIYTCSSHVAAQRYTYIVFSPMYLPSPPLPSHTSSSLPTSLLSSIPSPPLHPLLPPPHTSPPPLPSFPPSLLPPLLPPLQVIVATLISRLAEFENEFGVSVVGYIPQA